MADEKRNRRDQPQGGNQSQDRSKRDRKPGQTEPPGSGRARRQDEEEESQE
jgi:hypothetical protein